MSRHGMRSIDPKNRREQRRRNHISIDLRRPKYRHQIIERRLKEDEDEKRYRKYKDINFD